ncbi:hypothetical protein BRD01_09805 [Halobacteriales archaeon QS_8_65_32]|jgi:hypothetical protein|nr:MAG: hypothetical protein BRD01_09805 [Halobacteriales archaeon QS_8_65_32]
MDPTDGSTGTDRATERGSSPSDRGGRIDRRDLLRSFGTLGAIGTGTTAGIGLGIEAGTETAAASSHYTTYTVDAGETYRPNITSDESFENVFIDATADDADVQIDAYGSNWTVRNVGIRGELSSANGAAFRLQVNDGATGVFENVYLGDGAIPGDHGAVFVPTTHEGTLRIRELNVQYWPDNGSYGSATGRSERGGRGGLVTIERSFARNNNIAGFRLGTDRSVVRDSVVVVDGDVPANAGGQKNARGIWVKEGGSVRIENCDLLLADPDASYCVWEGDDNSVSLARVIDSEVAAEDGAAGKYTGNVRAENVGSDPTVERPPDVPTSAKEAALGRNLPKSIDFAGGSGDDNLRYSFETTGEIAGTRSTAEPGDSVSGGRASGRSVGASDIYHYSGALAALDANLPGDESIASVTVDRSAGRIEFARGDRSTNTLVYYFRVSGSIDPTDSIETEEVYSNSEAKGRLGGRAADAWEYTGDVDMLRVRLPNDGSILSVDIEPS